MPHRELRPLIRKLAAVASVTPEVEEALLGVTPIVRDFRPDDPIVREGDRPLNVAVVLSGFVYRYKMVEPDKRQIIAFHVAGDMPDLQGLHLDVMDHGVAASVATRIAFIPHMVVFGLIERHPPLAHVLWREALIDGAIFREWV
jgi:CRP-like cAMP-binding protein